MSIVLVTGAGSGFGELTALEFARKGHTVYATMPDPSRAAALARSAGDEGLKLKLAALDVTEKQSVEAAVDRVLSEEGRLDTLVNSAGIHLSGALEDMPESDLHRVMDTNFFGAINVIRAVLPAMRKQQAGRIILVSSIAAMIGRVNDAVYCASKSALESVAEALRYEVARFGIRVSVIEPGVFRTALRNKYGVSSNYPPNSPYSELVEFRTEKVRESFEQGDDPIRIAELILEIAASDEPLFRYPAGDQAREILPRLKQMNEAERDQFITQAAKIDWWLDGGPAPED